MMLSQTYQLSGTEIELCSVLSCIPVELNMAIEQLKSRNVADIYEQNGNIIFESRKRKRDCEIRGLRSKAGRISSTKRQHTRQHGASTRSASASASASVLVGGVGEGEWVPDIEAAAKWLAEWVKNGADYKRQEMESAFLALSANGWMWGKNPVVDFRAALERQIQTDRNNSKPYGKNHSENNPRNQGVVGDLAENARKTAEVIKRRQAERDAEHETV